MGQLISELSIDLGHRIRIRRLTYETADGDLAVSIGDHRPFCGKRESQMIVVVLVPAQQCDSSIRADVPGQCWREIHALTCSVIDEGIRWTVQQIQTSVDRPRS